MNKSLDKDLWLHWVCAATQSLPQDKITAAQHLDMHSFCAFYLPKFQRMNSRLLPDITLAYSHEQGFDWQKHGLYALVGMTSDDKVDFSCQHCTHVLYEGSSVVAKLCDNIRFEKDQWTIENNWSDDGAQLVSKSVPRTIILM